MRLRVYAGVLVNVHVGTRARVYACVRACLCTHKRDTNDLC